MPTTGDAAGPFSVGAVVVMPRFTPPPASDTMRARLLLASQDGFAAAGRVPHGVLRIAIAGCSVAPAVYLFVTVSSGA